MPIRAITLDLDDTLWPIWPTIIRAEEALHDWLVEHAPATALRYSVTAMRELREAVALEYPDLAHDFTAQRILTLSRAFSTSGDDMSLVEPAFNVFIHHRNVVDMYLDAEDALERLAARYPIAAVTNGNADLSKIGISHLFQFQLGAREHGAAKPDPSIFLTACERLNLAPNEVLHVGDDPELDVLGAQRAGLRSAWINRNGSPWLLDAPAPDYTVAGLDELVSRLERDTNSE